MALADVALVRCNNGLRYALRHSGSTTKEGYPESHRCLHTSCEALVRCRISGSLAAAQRPLSGMTLGRGEVHAGGLALMIAPWYFASKAVHLKELIKQSISSNRRSPHTAHLLLDETC